VRRIAFTSNRLLAVLVVLTLAAGMAWAAAEAEQAAGMEKEMVLDPTTGAMVTAPEYGGTLTYALRGDPPNPDTFYRHPPAMVAALVVEKLGMANMGVDRNYFDFRTNYLPDDIVVGRLAESWEQPDPETIVLRLRQGVRWHDIPPVNGREFVADDVVYTYRRHYGAGEGEGFSAMQWQSINDITSVEARDRYTVV
jgi:ABC-type transport system substrate-binding protein